MSLPTPEPVDANSYESQLHRLLTKVMNPQLDRPSATDNPEDFIRYCFDLAVEEPVMSTSITPGDSSRITLPKRTPFKRFRSFAIFSGGAVVASITTLIVGHNLLPKPEREVVYLDRVETVPSPYATLEIREIQPANADSRGRDTRNSTLGTFKTIVFRLPTDRKGGYVYSISSEGAIDLQGWIPGDGRTILGIATVESPDSVVFVICPNPDNPATVPSDLITWLSDANENKNLAIETRKPESSNAFSKRLAALIFESSQSKCSLNDITLLHPSELLSKQNGASQ